MKRFYVVFFLIFGVYFKGVTQDVSLGESTNVLIIGGGASGTMAAIQAARMGVSVTVLEETPWLGGMLTAAGVSAIDGNYKLESGLWSEFKHRLAQHYGGLEALKTGWVSNVLYEPQVGAKILLEMVENEKNITLHFQSKVESITKVGKHWSVNYNHNKENYQIEAQIVIDATELGDIAAKVGIPYDIGMDSKDDTGETIAPDQANRIIQDLTYVAILKEYKNTDEARLPKPKNYDPTPFLCTCKTNCDKETDRTLWDCEHMLNYGKLPNGYYMINWPIAGNDYYTNTIELSDSDRLKVYQKAKDYTLNYVYYLQNELGFHHVGLAKDVFPTEDNLPFIPYYRESRRIKGLVRFTLNDLAKPFDQDYALYRTGIAVGDYPVDHHHHAYPDVHNLPDLHFYPVPSYSVPLGVMIPKTTDHFIVAEKSISVTNIVNGTTRLQPVCILIGQAAGALAGLAIKDKVEPKEIAVREVQKELIKGGAYLLPYSDIDKSNPAFYALQRIGATGILKGEGKNIGWENHTHIYPDSLLTTATLKDGLQEWLPNKKLQFTLGYASYNDVLQIVQNLQLENSNQFKQPYSVRKLKRLGNKLFKRYDMVLLELSQPITRAQFAILLDTLINPFELKQVDVFGDFVTVSP